MRGKEQRAKKRQAKEGQIKFRVRGRKAEEKQVSSKIKPG